MGHFFNGQVVSDGVFTSVTEGGRRLSFPPCLCVCLYLHVSSIAQKVADGLWQIWWMRWVGDKNKAIRFLFRSGCRCSQWDTKRKLFSLAEVCTLRSALTVLFFFLFDHRFMVESSIPRISGNIFPCAGGVCGQSGEIWWARCEVRGGAGWELACKFERNNGAQILGQAV